MQNTVNLFYLHVVPIQSRKEYLFPVNFKTPLTMFKYLIDKALVVRHATVYYSVFSPYYKVMRPNGIARSLGYYVYI